MSAKQQHIAILDRIKSHQHNIMNVLNQEMAFSFTGGFLLADIIKFSHRHSQNQKNPDDIFKLGNYSHNCGKLSTLMIMNMFM